jgi:hypothetical protein
MHRRFVRHAVAFALGAGTAIVPVTLRAQRPAPVGARFVSTAQGFRVTASPHVARSAAPGSAGHAIKVGIAVGALAGAVAGGIVGSQAVDCAGDNSGVCPALGVFGGGALGLATGVVVGGVAGYVWHLTRPPVR